MLWTGGCSRKLQWAKGCSYKCGYSGHISRNCRVLRSRSHAERMSHEQTNFADFEDNDFDDDSEPEGGGMF